MKKTLFVIAGLLFFSLIINSCFQVDPVKERCEDWTVDAHLEKEIQEMTDATVAYANNPTKATCEAYKQATLKYLDGIKDWEECYVYYGLWSEFLASVEQAEESVKALDCSIY